jgi:hypothetical protein
MSPWSRDYGWHYSVNGIAQIHPSVNFSRRASWHPFTVNAFASCSLNTGHFITCSAATNVTTASRLPQASRQSRQDLCTIPTPAASSTRRSKRAHQTPPTSAEKSKPSRSPLSTVGITRTSFTTPRFLFRDYNPTLHRIDAAQNGSTIKRTNNNEVSREE